MIGCVISKLKSVQCIIIATVLYRSIPKQNNTFITFFNLFWDYPILQYLWRHYVAIFSIQRKKQNKNNNISGTNLTGTKWIYHYYFMEYIKFEVFTLIFAYGLEWLMRYICSVSHVCAQHIQVQNAIYLLFPPWLYILWISSQNLD